MDIQRGFSLVEALSVTAVTAVLVSVATPSFDAMVGGSRISAASGDLLGDLLLTRSEAMKRRLRVVMCKSGDGASCAAGGGWQQGWIVFEDRDGDGQRDAAEALLRVQPPLASSMRLTGTSPVAKYVSYAPNGATRLVGGGFQAGTLTVCAAGRRAGGRQIIVNASGRPRTMAAPPAACG